MVLVDALEAFQQVTVLLFERFHVALAELYFPGLLSIDSLEFLESVDNGP